MNERDAKLVQYLNEAYGKERELETALQAHIAMTTRRPYRKRLEQHLDETRGHARAVERRIKQLGGAAEAGPISGPGAVADAAGTVQTVARKGVALAKGPLHAVRGTGEQEKLLKNAKTEYSEEAEEIATYSAIEALSESVGDRETAKLSRGIRRDEERMARYLEKLIPTLGKSVARDEIPAPQRTDRSGRSRGTRSTGRRSRRSSRRSTGRSGSRPASRAGRRSSRSRGGQRSRSGSSAGAGRRS
jgi:ferritin-like metal-binding protein YciE